MIAIIGAILGGLLTLAGAFALFVRRSVHIGYGLITSAAALMTGVQVALSPDRLWFALPPATAVLVSVLCWVYVADKEFDR